MTANPVATFASHRYQIVRCSCGWLVDRKNPNRKPRELHDAHVLSVLSATHAIIELHVWSQAEKLFAERDNDHRWNHRCAEADVRCYRCDLRYGERQQYSCVIEGTGHSFDDSELAEARACDDDCPPWSPAAARRAEVTGQ